MPRGKNYVNRNRGVSMQASKKKTAPSMEQCFYGKGCTRKDCFYRHDEPGTDGGEGDKSGDPCMPFLAGLCTFTASGCKKRHPGKAEAELLIRKYSQMKCRYGDLCKLSGCLYIHPGDDNGDDTKFKLGGTAAFPPLAGSSGAFPRPVPPAGAWKPMAPAGAWKPMQPTGATTLASSSPALKPAWQPSPAPAAVPAWVRQGMNPMLVNHGNARGNVVCSPATATTLNGCTTTPVSAIGIQPKPVITADHKSNYSDHHKNNSVTPALRNSESPSLNINAKEFVPGGY